MDLLLTDGLLLLAGDAGFRTARGSVLVKNGAIVQIVLAEIPIAPEGCVVIDARDMIVMPGLVNGHMHGYGCLFRTPLANAPLEVWMSLAQPQRGVLDAETLYLSGLLAAAQSLLGGTTTLLDHVTASPSALNAVARAYVDAGIRAVVAPQVGDLPVIDTLPANRQEQVQQPLHASLLEMPAQAEAQLEMTGRFVEEWHNAEGRISVMVGPSAPHRCSEQLLRGLSDLASRHRLGIHTHLLETRLQRRIANERYGRSMVSYLDDLGMLSKRTSLAHAVWLAGEDIERIQARGSSVICSPASNLLLGGGLTPIPMLTDAGVVVALGTDGMNCSGSLSMFESMKLATALHRSDPEQYRQWTTPSAALEMATRGGARALGLEDRIGVLREGMRADLVLVRLDSLAMVPLLDPVGQLVLCEQGQGVDTVIVDGKIVVRNGRLLNIDITALAAEAQRMARSGRLTRGLAADQSEHIERLVSSWYQQEQ
jgi:5-methylthioadenosine/S-adenosylhomocysteine deaminase